MQCAPMCLGAPATACLSKQACKGHQFHHARIPMLDRHGNMQLHGNCYCGWYPGEHFLHTNSQFISERPGRLHWSALVHIVQVPVLFPAACAQPKQLEVELRSPKAGLMAEEISHRRGEAKVGASMEAVQAGQRAIPRQESQEERKGWIAFDAITVQT